MALIHGEFRPDLHAPAIVAVPDGMTRDEATRILTAAAANLRDAALDAAKASA